MNLIFDVMGEAVGKGRPRFVNRGGYVRAYTPKPTADYEKKVRDTFIKCFPEHKPIDKDTPIEVSVTIIKEIPCSWSKKKKAQAMNGEVLPTCKSDIDNYLKSILDALNGICYKDDASVVSVYAFKHYTWENQEPHAHISITTFEKENEDVEDK